ncbi:MAG TPA: Scr1 family TA system antitoxin-like transcriptional regulator [Pseudonocardiaceae bacterium]
MDDRDATLRGEHLGDELRRLRVEAKLTLVEAGRYIGASAPKLSKMERGRYGFQFEDVAGLLSVYRVVGERRHEMLAMAREANERPKICIRVVPNAEEGHPGLDGPFMRFHVPGRCGVVCLENRAFSIFLEEKADIRDYDGIIEHLQAIALSERDSAELIASVADELEGDADT